MDRENETGEPEFEVVLWPREEDYPRFVEVSTDSPVATYAEFVARAQPIVDAMRAQGLDVRIFQPDPDAMAAWCRAHFGQVNTTARAAYGAVAGLESPTEEDSIN